MVNNHMVRQSRNIVGFMEHLLGSRLRGGVVGWGGGGVGRYWRWRGVVVHASAEETAMRVEALAIAPARVKPVLYISCSVRGGCVHRVFGKCYLFHCILASRGCGDIRQSAGYARLAGSVKSMEACALERDVGLPKCISLIC
jgi:hypothetical protein